MRTTFAFIIFVISFCGSALADTLICTRPGIEGYERISELVKPLLGANHSDESKIKIYIRKETNGDIYYQSNYIRPGGENPTKIRSDEVVDSSMLVLNILDPQDLRWSSPGALDAVLAKVEYILDTSVLDAQRVPTIDIADIGTVSVVQTSVNLGPSAALEQAFLPELAASKAKFLTPRSLGSLESYQSRLKAPNTNGSLGSRFQRTLLTSDKESFYSAVQERLRKEASTLPAGTIIIVREQQNNSLVRLSSDGSGLFATDVSNAPTMGKIEAEIEVEYVGFSALLRGMQPAPVRGEPLRVALLRGENVTSSSMDAAMLSLALMAQREYGVSAIEWVDTGAEASRAWRPFFAGREASPMPKTLLVGPESESSDPPGVVRMYRDEAKGETVVSMQVIKATETRPNGVFVRAVAKTNGLARRFATMLRAWWSPDLALRSDEDLQAELDTLVHKQLSTYLNRNPNLAAQERPHGARVEFHIERGVNQMWVELRNASERTAQQTG